jgi:Zn-dependent M28 family amino/carboxypeptidase
VRPALGVGLVLVALAAVAATAPPAPAGPARVPRFDAGAAWRDVERLVEFGPRPAGSAALARAREYIVGELRRAGLEVRLGSFEARTPDGPVKMCNVVAMLPGRRREVIMLAGHYDTKLFEKFRFVGANDGGSSAGLLLELGRRLAGQPREFSYWVVFFDGEEARREWGPTDGTYGSRRLAAELERSGEIRRLRSVIVVDMIGDANLDIRRESYSTPWLTDIVWASARRLGYGAYFRSDATAIEDDHVPFLQAGVPAVDVIDIDYPPWHTADDTLAQISSKSLAIVGEVILDALPALETLLARGRGGGPE